MSDIFISYSRKDSKIVKIIAEVLCSKGWNIWWDTEIPPGKDYSQVIDEAINDTKIVIVVWSINSIDSNWVKTEASEGLRKKYLLPLLIDNINEDAIPIEFRRIETADLTNWTPNEFHPEFNRLIKTISRILESTIGDDEPAKEPNLFILKHKQITFVLIFLCFIFSYLFYQLIKTSEFTNSIQMHFTLIKSGSFRMGSPSYEVGRDDDENFKEETISKDFYMQTTEVTQKQWSSIMSFNPSYFKKCGENCPVECISYIEVNEFIEKLNKLENTRNYRLPTEREWEYAARASTTTAFNWGEKADCSKANFGNGENKQECNMTDSTMKVKSFQPNKWGLYDMHGNVNEWCKDWYTRPSPESKKITRGGGWNDKSIHCRSANRSKVDVTKKRANNIGFRLVYERN